jgi:hypothetical protein
MGGDSGQPAVKRPRMGGATLNSGGVPVPVTYHHQVTAQPYLYTRTDQSEDCFRSGSALIGSPGAGSALSMRNPSDPAANKLTRMTFIY